jgi:opacity protein-like surface antigen
MSLRLGSKLALFTLLCCAPYQVFSQVVPAARAAATPFSVGGGINYWTTDWGHTKMEGATVWADYFPHFVPQVLHGLGLEAEARDISWNKGDKPNNYRQATVGGELLYSWDHFRSFRPYIKGGMAFGGISTRFPHDPSYTHDTRTVTALGGGAQYRLVGHIWARADWEYQRWPALFGPNATTPYGFTFGAMYDFRHRSRY